MSMREHKGYVKLYRAEVRTVRVMYLLYCKICHSSYYTHVYIEINLSVVLVRAPYILRTRAMILQIWSIFHAIVHHIWRDIQVR